MLPLVSHAGRCVSCAPLDQTILARSSWNDPYWITIVHLHRGWNNRDWIISFASLWVLDSTHRIRAESLWTRTRVSSSPGEIDFCLQTFCHDLPFPAVFSFTMNYDLKDRLFVRNLAKRTKYELKNTLQKRHKVLGHWKSLRVYCLGCVCLEISSFVLFGYFTLCSNHTICVESISSGFMKIYIVYIWTNHRLPSLFSSLFFLLYVLFE